MDPRWQRIEDLFHRASALPPVDRGRFVQVETGDDPALAEEVQSLLASASGSHRLLDTPAVSGLPAGMLLGPYRIERALGSGGMGTVYLAHRADRQFDKAVAIKLVNQGLSAAVAGSRFDRERQLLARLEHTGIARLLDAGLSAHGQPYLVMEWVDGVHLDEWIRTEQPTLEQRLDLWLEIAGAVSYAHRNLVLHRDIKPSNIIVTKDGQAKLLDFGIGKMLEDQTGDATRTQQFTPLYASPEQVRGSAVATSTDIHSLGIILYEMITGRNPFREDSDPMDAVLHKAPVVPDTVPKDLAAIISMATRKEPERRYASADQFAEDVLRFLKKLPVQARPETLRYRFSKFVSRNRFAVGVATAALVGLIATAGIAVFEAQRAQRQLRRAEAVSGFLSSLMGVVPNGEAVGLRARGANLKVAELADAAAARAEKDFVNQPQAEATIRFIAGSVYNQLGLAAKAEPQARRAVELHKRLSAPGDPARSDAFVLLGTVALALGKFTEAEGVLLEAKREQQDPTPFQVAALESVLGTVQLRLGKSGDAELTYQHCLADMEARLGGNNPWIGLVLSNLAVIRQERGQFEEAIRLLERATTVARARRAEAPESLGWSALNLAIVARILERPEAALAAARESIDAFTESMGDSSPPTAQALTQLAWAKVRLGEIRSAEQDARRALAIEDAAYPKDHYERAVGLTWLGYVLLREDRLAEARPLLAEALALRKKASPNGWKTSPAMTFLAETTIRQGNRPAGLAMLQEQVDGLTALHGKSNVRTLQVAGIRDAYVQK